MKSTWGDDVVNREWQVRGLTERPDVLYAFEIGRHVVVGSGHRKVGASLRGDRRRLDSLADARRDRDGDDGVFVTRLQDCSLGGALVFDRQERVLFAGATCEGDARDADSR